MSECASATPGIGVRLERQRKLLGRNPVFFPPDLAALFASSSSSQDLLTATQQMQEEQMSFDLQYLQLQENMQSDARQYTCLLNITKTRYDAVRGIVANVK